MHVVAPRAVAQPHARADENAAAIEAVAQVSAAAPPERRIQPSAEGDGVGDRRQPRGHELRARDREVRTEKAMREPDGSVDLLPSYEYAVGPDGLPYVIGQGESVAPPEHAPPPEDDAEAAATERSVHARADVEHDDVEREPIERAPIETAEHAPAPREPEPIVDDHVTRSYAKLVEREAAPKLDTIA
ncbi:MAG TPA: hypothetical protein VFG69_05740 [Nannocystaceae bacterium]|nr:hypothetical protein [Nannocystaceae bacterium]